MQITIDGKTFEIIPLEACGFQEGEFVGNIDVTFESCAPLDARRMAKYLRLITPQSGRIAPLAYGDENSRPTVTFHDKSFQHAMPQTIELWWVDGKTTFIGTVPVTVEEKPAAMETDSPLSLERGWDYGKTELSPNKSALVLTRHRWRRVWPLLLGGIVTYFLIRPTWAAPPSVLFPLGFFVAAFVVAGMHVVARFDLREKTFFYRRSWYGISVRRCAGRIDDIQKIILKVTFYFKADDSGGPRRNGQLRFVYRGKKYLLECDGPCSWQCQARAFGKLLNRPVQIEEK